MIKAKWKYSADVISENSDNPRRLWNSINNILHRIPPPALPEFTSVKSHCDHFSSRQLFPRCPDIESTWVDIACWLTVYFIKCGRSARLGFDVGPASLTLDQHRACGVLVPRVCRVGIHAYLVYCCASRIVSIFLCYSALLPT